jgi:hypothetical protein
VKVLNHQKNDSKVQESKATNYIHNINIQLEMGVRWKFTPTKSAKPKGAVKANCTHYFTEKSKSCSLLREIKENST